MLELGPTQEQLHADAGALAARLGVDAVFGFGPLSRHAVEAAQLGGIRAEHFESIEALAAAMRKTLEGADAGAALLKGSRGMKLERTLAALGAT